MGSGAGKQRKYDVCESSCLHSATTSSDHVWGYQTPWQQSTPLAQPMCWVPQQPLHPASPKKAVSRTARAVKMATNWSRVEIEQLTIPQLVRWLEALGTDYTSAISRPNVVTRLWAEIQRQSLPAFQAIESPEHVNCWPLSEMLRWLEYFGALDQLVANKAWLVQLVLDQGEVLPAPNLLGEIAEDVFITQVQHHVVMVKNAAHTLLAQLSRDADLVEAQERAKHAWYPNGYVVAAFDSAELERTQGAEQTNESCYLNVEVGVIIDLTVHEASGWAWCIAAGEDGHEGWVPAVFVVEMASLLEDYYEDVSEEGMLQAWKGDVVDVIQRHYSGWSLCCSTGPLPMKGWLPDACLSDHPRNEATKQHRLVLNGLQRLAEDASGLESAFFRFRAKHQEEEISFEELYCQVLGLATEYQNICTVLHACAEADAQAQVEAQQVLATNDGQATSAGDKKAQHYLDWPSTPEKAILGGAEPPQKQLPEWVVQGRRCYWKSRAQENMLPVSVLRICQKRRQILVVFVRDETAHKIVSFDAFADPQTCPLRRTRMERQDEATGEARKADKKASEILDADLRDIMKEFGPDASEAGLVELSDSESDRSVSSTTSSSRSILELAAAPIEGSSPLSDFEPSSRSCLTQTGLPPAVGRVAVAMVELGHSSALRHEHKNSAISNLDATKVVGDIVAGDGCIHDVSRDEPSGADNTTKPSRVGHAFRSQDVMQQNGCQKQRAATYIQAAFRRRSGVHIAVQRMAAAAVQVYLAKGEHAVAAQRMRGQSFLIRDLRDLAVHKLQRHYRKYLAQKHMKWSMRESHSNMLEIRALIKTHRSRLMLQALGCSREHLEMWASTLIQKSFRGHRARTDAKIVAQSNALLAEQIQCLAYTRIARRHLWQLRRERAIVNIQWCWRGHLGRRHHVTVMSKWRESASRIQCFFRIKRARADLAELKFERAALVIRAALSIQRCWRGEMARRSSRALFPLMMLRHQAALRIQGFARVMQAKHQLQNLRQAKQAQECLAAMQLQRFWRGQRVREVIAPEMKVRQLAAFRIQGFHKMWLARHEVRLLRNQRQKYLQRILAQVQISTFVQGLLACAKVRELRLKIGSVVKIQSIARGMSARKTVNTMLHQWRLAVALIQAVWRGRLGREIALKLRADVMQHKAALGIQSWWRGTCDKRTTMQLRAEVDAALELLARGMQDDRNFAAAALAKMSSEHAKSIDIGVPLGDQDVSIDKDVSSDKAACEAMIAKEALLSRLSIGDACDMVASIAQMTWKIAATYHESILKNAPKPDEAMRRNLKALVRRLHCEVGGCNKFMESCSDSFDIREEAASVLEAEKVAISKAEEQAIELRSTIMDKLKKEHLAACTESETLLDASRHAIQRVADEVTALKCKSCAETNKAEATLREIRAEKHAQTVVLHEFALTMQLEKERLEAELSSQRPRAQVVQHVIAVVKALQEQLKEREVSGASSRKSQGLLAHTLRALESRANKGLQRIKAEGGQGWKSSDHLPEFQPSEGLRQRQERQDELENQYLAALETEVSNMRAARQAEASKQVAAIGAHLRNNVEEHSEAIQRAISRLIAWQASADQARPWLGYLVPVAKAIASLTSAAEQVRSAPASHISVTLKVVARQLDTHYCAMVQHSHLESPRLGMLTELLASLQAIQISTSALQSEYPDVDNDLVPETIVQDADAQAVADFHSGSYNQSPVKGLVHPLPKVSPASSPRPLKTKAPFCAAPKVGSFATASSAKLPGMNGWAGLAELGTELCALSDALATAPPQVAGIDGHGARGGPRSRLPTKRPPNRMQERSMSKPGAPAPPICGSANPRSLASRVERLPTTSRSATPAATKMSITKTCPAETTARKFQMEKTYKSEKSASGTGFQSIKSGIRQTSNCQCSTLSAADQTVPRGSVAHKGAARR